MRHFRDIFNRTQKQEERFPQIEPLVHRTTTIKLSSLSSPLSPLSSLAFQADGMSTNQFAMMRHALLELLNV